MNSKTLQSSFPNPFPPSWAESWGEDEFGLYANFNLSGLEQRINDLEHEVRQLSPMEKDGVMYGKKRLIVPFVTQRFRWIAAGDFIMGSSNGEPERSLSEDQHKVTLSNGYWLADTIMIEALWLLVMGRSSVYSYDDTLNLAMQMSWEEAQKLIDQFNEKLSGQLDDLVVRLPTEAEWEHACRAGTTTPFSFGENITSEQVNFDASIPYNNGKRSENRSKEIAAKTLPPNAWGLYEMHGNVWEWCADAWQNSLGTQPMVDPYHGGDISARRIVRGGSWIRDGRHVRSAYRLHRSPDFKDRIGLRLSIGHELKARSAKKK